MTHWLTDERKSLLLGAFAWAFAGALGVLAALWAVAALIVGSYRIIAWIGGIA